MMNTKYNLTVSEETVRKSIKRIINLTYKLLPTREEGGDWKKPLETIIEELVGMNDLFLDQQDKIFVIICKLQGIFNLTEKDDFQLYRRTIFECLSLLNGLEL
ncbi:MAG: hypothetical protein PUJ51_22490 [Clostridiales bacterium]|nr:hypothetical protein [Clostridiales bacterium]